jgi:hypothetical protein
MKPTTLLCLALYFVLDFAGSRGFASAASKGRINVILWFDTEDYLLPADDDATKRLAEMLTDRGIRATFKLVGEKARVLERRGRHDVIAALKKHDIGYHSDFHSVHPTPAEYLADCGLLDGMSEFIRREGAGAADVRRIFGVETLSCYGQPGSSWGPQTMAALAQIGVAPHGVQCYVDEGDHVGLKGYPFWYCNTLVVYNMRDNYTRMELHNPRALDPAKQKVSSIVDRLQSKDGGGLISIFYHPCEWVHVEFWDGVNFRRGANPPREEWKPPPGRSPEETEGAFQRFAQYIDYIRSLPDLRFVTAADLPLVYPDRARDKGTTETDVRELAERVSQQKEGLDFQPVGDAVYSLADQFEILSHAVDALLQGRQPVYPIRTKGLLGPDAPPPGGKVGGLIRSAQLRQTARDVLNFVTTERRVPARVFLGPEAIPPSDWLVMLAQIYRHYQTGGTLPHQGLSLPASHLELLPEKHVAKDTAGLFGGWVIHKEDFRAPKILDVARLQAWTLKPARAKN